MMRQRLRSVLRWLAIKLFFIDHIYDTDYPTPQLGQRVYVTDGHCKGYATVLATPGLWSFVYLAMDKPLQRTPAAPRFWGLVMRLVLWLTLGKQSQLTQRFGQRRPRSPLMRSGVPRCFVQPLDPNAAVRECRIPQQHLQFATVVPDQQCERCDGPEVLEFRRGRTVSLRCRYCNAAVRPLPIPERTRIERESYARLVNAPWSS